jgi:hypothetical protein
MKVARRVRGGGVKKGHSVYLVGVLLYHMAHEERQDGCHSPAEVLGWIKGMQPEEAVVHEAFSAICETRRLDKAGYAKFRNWSHDARTRPGRGDHAGQYLPGFPHPGV